MIESLFKHNTRFNTYQCVRRINMHEFSVICSRFNAITTWHDFSNKTHASFTYIRESSRIIYFRSFWDGGSNVRLMKFNLTPWLFYEFIIPCFRAHVDWLVTARSQLKVRKKCVWREFCINAHWIEVPWANVADKLNNKSWAYFIELIHNLRKHWPIKRGNTPVCRIANLYLYKLRLCLAKCFFRQVESAFVWKRLPTLTHSILTAEQIGRCLEAGKMRKSSDRHAIIFGATLVAVTFLLVLDVQSGLNLRGNYLPIPEPKTQLDLSEHAQELGGESSEQVSDEHERIQSNGFIGLKQHLEHQ